MKYFVTTLHRIKSQSTIKFRIFRMPLNKFKFILVIITLFQLDQAFSIVYNHISEKSPGILRQRKLIECDSFKNTVVLKCSSIDSGGLNSSKSNDKIVITSLSTNSEQIVNHSPILLINTMMFFLFTTFGASQPFLPIFYRNIGLTDSRIGILGALNPAMTFLVSPLWGAFADRTGWYKGIMLATFIGSLLSRLLLAVPLFNSNFLILCAIVTVSSILNAPVRPLMDEAIMSLLKDKSEYGKSRIYGQMGFGVGAWLSGQISSRSSSLLTMFEVQALLGVPTSILMILFKPKKIYKTKAEIVKQINSMDNSSEKLTKKASVLSDAVSYISHNSEILTFFILVFLVGISCGIIENFGYVRLTELGGAKDNCMGYSRLLSTCIGGPMFYISGKITKEVGVNNILSFSLLAYIIRFLIYSVVKNPWHALPAEVLRGLSFGLFWSGATFYVYNESPKGLTATFLGILNAVYNGIGQSVGALLGGALSKKYEIVNMFRYTAIADAIVLILFSLQRLYVSMHRSKNRLLKAAPKNTTAI